MLPNVHVITLRETPERTRSIGNHLDGEGISWTEFPGINAIKWGLRTVHTFEYDNPGKGYIIGPKTVGIHLSHYMLWRHLHALSVQYPSESVFTILEDDARFIPGWKERMDTDKFLVPKDWDVLFLGSCDCAGKPTRHIAGGVYEVKYPMCLHAYMVTQRGLKVMIETQERAGAPVDIGLVLDTFPKLKVYTLLPRISDQPGTVITP